MSANIYASAMAEAYERLDGLGFERGATTWSWRITDRWEPKR